MKFGHSSCFFLNTTNLIYRSTDISKCFSGSLQFRVNLQIILSKEIKEYILKFEMILSVTTIVDKTIKKTINHLPRANDRCACGQDI